MKGLGEKSDRKKSNIMKGLKVSFFFCIISHQLVERQKFIQGQKDE
jgi:hypothetical protein